MELQNYEVKPFVNFAEDWALLTAGTINDFNSMTIAWGGLGTIWNKPVAFLLVKPSRYTFDFVQKHTEITVSWYDEKFKKELASTFGAKSGRDINKVAQSGFTPEEIDGCVTYKEASQTIVLKKLFMQQLDRSLLPKECFKWYPLGTKEEQLHYLIIAKVLKIA